MTRTVISQLFLGLCLSLFNISFADDHPHKKDDVHYDHKSHGHHGHHHKHHKTHSHRHGKKCGHKAVKHGDHKDYVHEGHHHHQAEGHTHDCEKPEKKAKVGS